jgi:hypothetical protein
MATQPLPLNPAPKLMRLADIEFTGNEFWRPINDQQLTALHCRAQALLYGGASGGGKTDFAVGDSAQEYDNPNLRALIIRRSFAEMPQIIDRTRSVYSQMGATYRGDDHTWRFPSGAQIRLGYINSTGDIGNYRGNPFTCLHVDESTYLREKSIRDILPWLASTDPSIFCRIRLETNPGEVGADWHQHVFLRGKCPLHFAAESVIPGRVYKGSKWMDGVPTYLTTCFIPSLATDNPFYGQEKIDRLRSQTAENAEKLLRGCWCQLEGAYFKFLRPNYKLPVALADDKWWKRHIISVDYGFGESWAAAHLYSIDESSTDFPEGRMWMIGELAKQEMGSEDFAKLVGTAFIEPLLEGNRRQFEYAVFDPATDAQTGTGRSNFDIMSEVLSDKYDLSCLKAAKGAGSRVSNAQNLYRMLKSGPPIETETEKWKPGQLVITDAAPITFSSLQTRMHDPDHPGDIKKVRGDPKDDCYDSLAYGANTFFSGSEKPRQVDINTKLKQYQEAGMDEHSLNIYRLKMERDASGKDAPITIGRRHGTIIRKS